MHVGSVGQPRDGDPRAAYVVYDAEAQIFTFQRVACNIEKTQEDLRKIGLPEDLANRLSDAAQRTTSRTGDFLNALSKEKAPGVCTHRGFIILRG